MFCKYCGNELGNNSKFCSTCGKQIDENDNLITNPINTSECENGYFCTNCGNHIGKLKMCPQCYMKSKRNYKKFCLYCGGAIVNNRCSKCNTVASRSIFEIIARVITVITFIWSVFMALFTFSEIVGREREFNINVAPAFLILIISVLLMVLFFRKSRINSIKKKLLYRKALQKVALIIIYTILPIMLAIGSTVYAAFITTTEYTYKSYAISAVQSELEDNLKNSDSLQVNNINTITAEDNEYYYYHITIDYSAQNGFGGYNRDKYERYVKVWKGNNQFVQNSNAVEFSAALQSSEK